jgi:predicted nucleotidyltransferase component of viral defense system
MLTDIQAREACHVVLLRCLVDRVPEGLRLKGGVNLRLFFGSVRYSEDMDFDADLRHQPRMQGYLAQVIQDPGFKQALEPLGIDDVIPNREQGPPGKGVKYKMQVLHRGVPLATKVEVSFRESTPAEWATETPVPSPILDTYGQTAFQVSQYPHAVAVVQKVNALATRAGVQARDIFDLDWLLNQDRFPNTKDAALALLRQVHPDERLREASARCLEAHDEQYQQQVEAFLEESARAPFHGQWEDIRLRVHGALEEVRQRPMPVIVPATTVRKRPSRGKTR